MKILFYFFLISRLSLAANHAGWVAVDNLPYEVQSLVESFKMAYLTDEEKKDLKLQLTELDSLMTNLSQGDRFFLAKSSVYKWILKYPPQVKPPKSFTLDMFLEVSNTKDLSPFAKWLVLALKSDSIDIQQNPGYQQYLKLKNDKNTPFTLIGLKKRIDLILPWAYLFYQNQGENLNLQLVKHQFTLLKDVVEQYKLFYRFKGSRVPEQSKKLTLFKFQENIQDNSKTIDESLSELDKIIEKHRKAGIPVPVNEWSISKNDEWSPGDDEGIILKADPSYSPPKELPKPVDDWN